MTIRAFLCQWTETATPDGGLFIDNPIDTALNDVTLSAPVVGVNFYARLSLAKRPDRLYMLKIMRGNLTDAEWTFIDNIGGVQMLPAGSFDRATSTLNNPTKNRIYTALDSMGIARTVFDSAATIGGFLRNLTAELDPSRVGFGPWELLAAEWA
jgi:hypothetical protein